MVDSILKTIRSMRGLDSEDNTFDSELIPYINTALFRLNTLGVITHSNYNITGENETWADVLQESINRIGSIQTYMALRTQALFDPPTSAYLLSAIESEIQELEWTLEITNE